MDKIYMKTNNVTRLTTLLIVVSVVFLYGCVNYLAPTQGAVALEKSQYPPHITGRAGHPSKAYLQHLV